MRRLIAILLHLDNLPPKSALWTLMSFCLTGYSFVFLSNSSLARRRREGDRRSREKEEESDDHQALPMRLIGAGYTA